MSTGNKPLNTIWISDWRVLKADWPDHGTRIISMAAVASLVAAIFSADCAVFARGGLGEI